MLICYGYMNPFLLFPIFLFIFFLENNVDDNDKQANNRFFCQKQQEIFIEICISLGFLFLAPFFTLAIYFCS